MIRQVNYNDVICLYSISHPTYNKPLIFRISHEFDWLPGWLILNMLWMKPKKLHRSLKNHQPLADLTKHHG